MPIQPQPEGLQIQPSVDPTDRPIIVQTTGNKSIAAAYVQVRNLYSTQISAGIDIQIVCHSNGGQLECSIVKVGGGYLNRVIADRVIVPTYTKAEADQELAAELARP